MARRAPGREIVDRQKSKGLKELGSYENVLAVFNQFDSNRDGKFSYTELHSLMYTLNKGSWTEAQTNRLMVTLDKDANGSCDINEFLSYIFESPSAMGGTAGQSEYEVVLQYFRAVDSDRNGTLDKAEFTRLMSSLYRGQWSRAHTDQMWGAVDSDHNGNVDSAELVAYIFGVPKERKQAAAAKRGGGGPLVVVEILVGPGQGEQWARMMKARWEKVCGDKVGYRTVVNKDISGVMSVTARNGQVVFWDRASMIMYREDPFNTMQGAKDWIDDAARRHLPRLISGT